LERKPVFDSGLTIAFQPVAEISGQHVYAYEAVVRGPGGETAAELLEALAPDARAEFDLHCALTAIRCSARAGLPASGARLSIPVHAPAIGAPAEHLETILHAARRAGLIPERLILALHGYQQIARSDLAELVDGNRKAGPLTAFVGLASDQAGLGLCGRYAPELVKLEPELVGAIASSWSRRLVLEDIVPRIRSLGIRPIATGVDSEAVLQRLRSFGIELVQGEHIARPEIGALPSPALRRAA
jgi:EAL domain-containing protein (putative c-di-GMP-specific phosphodiesterase class I)